MGSVQKISLFCEVEVGMARWAEGSEEEGRGESAGGRDEPRGPG